MVPSYNLRSVSFVKVCGEPRDWVSKLALQPNFTTFFHRGDEIVSSDEAAINLDNKNHIRVKNYDFLVKYTDLKIWIYGPCWNFKVFGWKYMVFSLKYTVQSENKYIPKIISGLNLTENIQSLRPKMVHGSKIYGPL